MYHFISPYSQHIITEYNSQYGDLVGNKADQIPVTLLPFSLTTPTLSNNLKLILKG